MNHKTHRVLKSIAILSFIAYPTLLIVSFALHYTSFTDFFIFKLNYVQVPVEQTVRMLMSNEVTRNFIGPHIVAYSAIPFLILSAISIGAILIKKAPAMAIIGTLTTLIGAIFLGGVFAAWTSFAALGNMSMDMYDNAVTSFKMLTTMQGPLALFSGMSGLAIIGFLILSVGLFISKAIPNWSVALLFMGHLIIMVFMDLDNWMLIGAVLILIGMHPVISYLKHYEERNYLGKQESQFHCIK